MQNMYNFTAQHTQVTFKKKTSNLTTFYDTKTAQASHGLRGSAGLKMPTYAHFFRRAISTRKVGQTDLGLVREEGSLVDLCKRDYKSLCAAVTMCATLVKIQGHRQHLISLYEKLSQLS